MNNVTKILLIEDNPGDARLIIEYLSPADNQKFNVTVADRLESGKELLAEESFDAVLLDLNLPNWEGLATFDELHQHAPMVPVIVLTGLDNDSVGIAALKRGAQDYLIKGEVDRPALVRSIRYAIERASLERQLLQSNQSLEERVQLRTQELEAARERALRSEKLAIIGRLSGGIAHDLRNPLGAIKNAAYLIGRKFNAGRPIEDNSEIRKLLELVDSEIVRANIVITKLLSIGPEEDLPFSKIQIADVIRDSMAGFVLNENIQLSLTIEPDLPTIDGDASQLVRALQNLLGNAQDAMAQGGELGIAAQRKDDWVEIVVTDTGCGISAQNIDRIFEPLYSDKTDGTGLGLAICLEIIGKHNGSISVESQLDSGSKFTILVPIAAPDNKGLDRLDKDKLV